MEYMKPRTPYRIVTVQIAVPDALWATGEAQDGISALLDNECGATGVVADWAYLETGEGPPLRESSDSPREGELF